MTLVLNWFSPLPPEEGAAAAFTARLLPLVAERVDVVAWTDRPEWTPVAARHAEVRRFAPGRLQWAELNRAEMTIYVLEDEPARCGVLWRTALEHAGVIVLHGASVHRLVLDAMRSPVPDRDGYLTLLERVHGRAARADGRRAWSGLAAAPLVAARWPMTAAAAWAALGFLADTRELASAVQEQAACPVAWADPEAAAVYVDVLLALVEEARRHRPRAAARRLEQGVARAVGHWMDEEAIPAREVISGAAALHGEVLEEGGERLRAALDDGSRPIASLLERIGGLTTAWPDAEPDSEP